MTGSCGMMESARRSVRSPSRLMSWPSIQICPAQTSTILKSTCVIVDLPLPVRPQMPTESRLRITQSTPASASGSPSR
jgi:hypothetical protein